MQSKQVLVVGLGGSGCKVVSCLADADTATCAVSSDAKSLAAARAATKLQIGKSLTRGMGTGGDVQLARQAAGQEADMIRSLFEGVDLVILVTGLGGGTGSGAGPVLLDMARASGAVTLGFVTLPFDFEGADRKARADRALAEFRRNADAVVVIPNDRLFESVDATRVKDAFARADAVLAHGASALCRAITHPGFISLDFADLRRLVRHGRGLCTFGYGQGKGKQRARSALKDLLGNPMLEQGRVVAEATSLLISIVGGAGLTLKEVGDIMGGISEKTGPDTEVFMGTVIDEDAGQQVAVNVLAAGRRAVPAGTDAGEKPRVREPREHDMGAGAARQLQTSFRLDASGKGRFKNVEPTVLDGEDLDIPTFLRRGLNVEDL